jgi:hypothetical protein
MQGSPDLTDAHTAFIYTDVFFVWSWPAHTAKKAEPLRLSVLPSSGFASPELTQAHSQPSIVNRIHPCAGVPLAQNQVCLFCRGVMLCAQSYAEAPMPRKAHSHKK